MNSTSSASSGSSPTVRKAVLCWQIHGLQNKQAAKKKARINRTLYHSGRLRLIGGLEK
jgi:hypothetical protein